MVDASVDLKSFDTLNIDVRSANVMLTRGDSSKLEYRTEKGQEPVIDEKSGKLTVTQPEVRHSFFIFQSGSEKDIYRIMIPDDKTIDLTVQSNSGDISLDRINVSGDVTSKSGDVLLNDLEGDQLIVNTMSGEIGSDKVKMGKVSFSSKSGDMDILRLFTDDLFCDSSSGDIEINNSEIKIAECETRSGDVEIELQGNGEDYSYLIDTNSGDIKVNGRNYEEHYQKDGGSRRIGINTTSGDIEVTVQ